VAKSEAETYVDAISKSVQSICDDDGLSADEKLEAMRKSMGEFDAAVEKYNHNHDLSNGQFSSGGGGGTAASSAVSKLPTLTDAQIGTLHSYSGSSEVYKTPKGQSA